MKIILLGPPGAGKGTQAVLITRDFGVAHISTGDIFRANLRDMTPLGKLAKSYMDKGELVPDDVTIQMVEDRLAQPDCARGFMLDGFPRTLAQAESFGNRHSVDLVLEITSPDAMLIRRAAGRRMCACGATYHVDRLDGRTTCEKCGGELYQRADDREETVQKRLDVYKEQTAPLSAYYAGLGLLKTIDGARSIEAVYADVKPLLEAIE